jgi:hypothetical protein
MTLAFLWWWSKASITRPNWRDGLRAALEVIERNHTVDWYLDEDFPEDHYDAYLIWVLESMACGIVPEVNPANRKAFSYIKEMYDQKTNPREFVLSHYSSEGYAEKLLKGLT